MIAKRATSAILSLRMYLRSTGAVTSRWDAVADLEAELNRLDGLAEKGKTDSQRAKRIERDSEKEISTLRAQLEDVQARLRERGMELTAVKSESKKTLLDSSRTWNKERSEYEKQIAKLERLRESDAEKLRKMRVALEDHKQADGARERTLIEMQGRLTAATDEVTRLEPFETLLAEARSELNDARDEIFGLRKIADRLSRVRDLINSDLPK